MGIEDKIKFLGVPQTKLCNFYFQLAAILKMAETRSRSQLVTGNMWSLNQVNPLNLMLQLAKVMGCMRGLSAPVV